MRLLARYATLNTVGTKTQARFECEGSQAASRWRMLDFTSGDTH